MTDTDDQTSEIDQIQIKYLGDVQRLELKPGDILVLTIPTGEILPMAAKERLQSYLMEHVPGHKVFVLDGGLKMGVLSVDNGSL